MSDSGAAIDNAIAAADRLADAAEANTAIGDGLLASHREASNARMEAFARLFGTAVPQQVETEGPKEAEGSLRPLSIVETPDESVTPTPTGENQPVERPAEESDESHLAIQDLPVDEPMPEPTRRWYPRLLDWLAAKYVRSTGQWISRDTPPLAEVAKQIIFERLIGGLAGRLKETVRRVKANADLRMRAEAQAAKIVEEAIVENQFAWSTNEAIKRIEEAITELAENPALGPGTAPEEAPRPRLRQRNPERAPIDVESRLDRFRELQAEMSWRLNDVEIKHINGHLQKPDIRVDSLGIRVAIVRQVVFGRLREEDVLWEKDDSDFKNGVTATARNLVDAVLKHGNGVWNQPLAEDALSSKIDEIKAHWVGNTWDQYDPSVTITDEVEPEEKFEPADLEQVEMDPSEEVGAVGEAMLEALKKKNGETAEPPKTPKAPKKVVPTAKTEGTKATAEPVVEAPEETKKQD